MAEEQNKTEVTTQTAQTTQNNTETVSKAEYDILMNKFSDLLNVVSNLTARVEQGVSPSPAPTPEPAPIDENKAFVDWFNS